MRTPILLATLFLAAAATAQTAPSELKRGQATYARCAGCHSFQFDLAGPRLCDLIGRRAGSVPGFEYSASMKRSDIVWSAKTLDRFLANPAKALPGTSMTAGAVPERAARRALVAYLLAANQGAECHGPT